MQYVLVSTINKQETWLDIKVTIAQSWTKEEREEQCYISS